MKDWFKKTLLDGQFFRFLLVGICNTIVGTGVMFLLYNLAGCSYWISSAANYIVGGILSYFLNKYFTFKNQERSIPQVVRFVLTLAVCYLIAYGAAKPLVARLLSGCNQKLQENVAMVAGMGFYTILNYLGQRFFAFHKKADMDT